MYVFKKAVSEKNAWHKWPHLYLKSAYWQVCKIYAKEKTKSCISCFIDFRKAFDVTPRQKLFDKLRRGRIRGLFLEVLISMYSDDKSVVKIANKLTLFSPYHSGVKQGYMLSPTLFNFYPSDLPKLLNSAAISANLFQEKYL